MFMLLAEGLFFENLGVATVTQSTRTSLNNKIMSSMLIFLKTIKTVD